MDLSHVYEQGWSFTYVRAGVVLEMCTKNVFISSQAKQTDKQRACRISAQQYAGSQGVQTGVVLHMRTNRGGPFTCVRTWVVLHMRTNKGGPFTYLRREPDFRELQYLTSVTASTGIHTNRVPDMHELRYLTCVRSRTQISEDEHGDYTLGYQTHEKFVCKST